MNDMSYWLNPILTIIISVVGGAIAYGIFSGKTQAEIISLKRDIEQLRTNTQLFVTRTEYESRHQDIRENLRRIEAKVDQLVIHSISEHSDS
jgi:protein-arginine kinase activator protein McsA